MSRPYIDTASIECRNHVLEFGDKQIDSEPEWGLLVSDDAGNSPEI